MTVPKVLSIILNYRTPEMTLKSAEAALVALEGIAGSLTIVDNDSGDGSYEKILAEAEARGWTKDGRVRVLQSGHNGGFGAGNNFGIRAGLPDGSAPDYVYILNSDAFPEPAAIRALLDYLEAHPRVGFAGSAILSEEGEIETTAFRFPTISSEFEGAARTGPITKLLSRHVVALPVPQESCEVDWLAGASMMMRRETLDQVGLFDETFFLYFEETDLCRRTHLAGWPIAYVRESRVMHIGSVSTGMKKWQRVPGYWLDSRQYYFAKNYGRAYATLATFAHLAGGLIWRLRQIVSRRNSDDPPHFLRDLMAHWARTRISSPTGALSQRTANAPRPNSH